MAYLDRVHACNGWEPAEFLPLRADGLTLGWIRPQFADHLRAWPTVFRVEPGQVRLADSLQGLELRTQALAQVLEQLVAGGLLGYRHGELYPVGLVRDQPLFLLDRAAAAQFGIRAYGQHLNGYVRDSGQISLWVGRRSANKRNFPGLLDHLAAGGLPHGLSLRQNLIKECWEEAGVSSELASQAQPVGAITYCRQTPAGLKPDTIYCYDLELPAGFQPRCVDGEVEEFSLLPLDEVADLVKNTERFKANCSLVIIDFLIRHGWLGPETEDYLDIIHGLHPPLP